MGNRYGHMLNTPPRAFHPTKSSHYPHKIHSAFLEPLKQLVWVMMVVDLPYNQDHYKKGYWLEKIQSHLRDSMKS